MADDKLHNEFSTSETFSRRLQDQRDFQSLSRTVEPGLNKRRPRAVLTKEQAIEVYQQKLANEALSTATSATSTIAANAAVVARRSSLLAIVFIALCLCLT